MLNKVDMSWHVDAKKTKRSPESTRACCGTRVDDSGRRLWPILGLGCAAYNSTKSTRLGTLTPKKTKRSQESTRACCGTRVDDSGRSLDLVALLKYSVNKVDTSRHVDAKKIQKKSVENAQTSARVEPPVQTASALSAHQNCTPEQAKKQTQQSSEKASKTLVFSEARTSAATRSLFPPTNSPQWSLLCGTNDTLTQ